jgi:protein SCO1/2
MRFLFSLLILVPAAALHATAEPAGTLSLTVPAVVLHDQNGARVDVAELLRGGVVVMNFVFTSCTTICSPMGANFGALQKRLPAGTRLVSVSIDPENDTPARMKKWGAQFHAGPAWTLLTGDRASVERLLKSLGVYTANRFTHSPILLVGNADSGRWLRGNGLAAPADVVSMIDRLRGVAAPAASGVRR